MEDYVTYEQAKTLKDLGFDWECNHWYHIDEEKLNISYDYVNHNTLSPKALSAPTLGQAQKWLFENRSYFISIQYNNEKETFQCIIYKQTFTQGYYCTNESYSKEYFQGCEDITSYDPTYCLSKGITKVLELIKGK